MEYIIIVLLVAVIILLVLILLRQSKGESNTLEETIKQVLNDGLKESRKELNTGLKDNRVELSNSISNFQESFIESLGKLTDGQKDAFEKLTEKMALKLDRIKDGLTQNSKDSREELSKSLKEFQEAFTKNVKEFNELQERKFNEMKGKQDDLVEATEKKLEQMRVTVDEKLQKTLNERLGQSFEQVGKQLESVQKGLGEMQTLAQDVGGLKRVLSNVKMRGGIGEVQLEMLLENLLAPDQYEANVKTKSSSNDIVEFAIKLPGKDTALDQVWLPVDAKFPKDAYSQLQDAYDIADARGIEIAQKNLENTIKKMAKDIRDKYLDPPFTTDFGIMFLPFEGIYAEVVRKAELLDILQREYRVIVTGPTTFAAILNSLQMGFKTLSIEKHSSEIKQVLGAVKTEFNKFGGMLEKAQNNIQTGMNQLDNVMGVRTRAISRKLKNMEALSESETQKILPELSTNDIIDDIADE